MKCGITAIIINFTTIPHSAFRICKELCPLKEIYLENDERNFNQCKSGGKERLLFDGGKEKRRPFGYGGRAGKGRGKNTCRKRG